MQKYGGLVSERYSFWKTICNNRQILKYVGGVKIPFTCDKVIQSVMPREIRMSQEERKYARQKIEKLLKTGCIVSLPHPIQGWRSNIFLRPKKDGSFRLILNLKPLNKMIEYQKFKMPTITTVLQMVRRDDKFVSLDLQDAFACVRMSQKDFCYLRFSSEKKHYMYTVLPNGIAIGPCVFVALTKVITAHLRKLGIDIVIYIDDTLIINPCIVELQKHAGIACEVFE